MVRISHEEYARIVSMNRNAAALKAWITPEKIAEKAASKYRNVKVENQYGKFDSIKEANRYPELLILQRCGVISDLRRQVRFELSQKNGKELAIVYVADYVYQKDGKTVVEDVKWFRTNVYKMKRKMFLLKFPDIVFVET